MTVTLTWGEFAVATLVASFRMGRALRRRAQEPHGKPAERGEWEVVVEGCAAEMAAAKALKLYWSDSPELDYDGDIGGGFHVRSTDLADGHLILYDRDPADAYFVLVTGRAPIFDVRGFIVARDGKQDEYRSNGRLRTDGWMVPQAALSPIEELLW